MRRDGRRGRAALALRPLLEQRWQSREIKALVRRMLDGNWTY